jgi:hypothetical protein
MNPIAKVVEIMFLRRFRSVIGELPASYFCLLGMDDYPPLYGVVSQMLENAAHMHDWHYQDVLQGIKEFRETGKTGDLPKILAILGDMLVLPATSTFYHGDHSLDKAVDRFQMSIFNGLGQGDCEDVAKDVHYFATGIQKLSSDHPELGDLVWLLQQYVFVMITGVATSPSLQRPGSMDTGENPREYICHVWSMAIPKARWNTWKTQKPTGSITTQMEQLIEIGALILEATNFTTALHRSLDVYYEEKKAQELAVKKWRRAALRMELPNALAVLPYPLPAIPTLKKPETLGEQSRFYRFAVSAWVYPEDDEDPIDLTFIRNSCFGITMTELLECPEDLILRPNFRRKLDTRAILKLLEYESPRQPLVVRTSAELPSLHGFQFDPSSTIQGDWLTFRLQHIQEFTEGTARALESFRQRTPGTRITALMLPVTEDFYLVEIHLYFPSSLAVSAKSLRTAQKLSP